MDTFRGLKLLAHCGGGAFGDVYFCEDITGKKMAVKIISKKRIGDSWERELTGVKNYRKITENAPGLLQIFHVEDDEENFFYTMEPADSVSDTEYVPDTLARRLHSGALPQTDLFRILSGVFNGIKTLHDAGFAHRDIKPDNILFVKGVPKLADIGLLSALSHTVTQLAGTLDFIPPEERTAESLESSDKASRQRNDLYAFGKVIYCAVTGNEPHQYPGMPKDFQFTLPFKYFFRLAMQLCCKDPVKRLNNIEELAKEMADIERKLLYGETLLDKIRYAAKQFRIGVKSSIVSSLRFIKRYWYLVLLFLLVGGGAVWYLMKPVDLPEIKDKPFKSWNFDIKMTIPAQWKAALETLLRKELKKGVQANSERYRFVEDIIKSEADWICLDFPGGKPMEILIHAASKEIDFLNMPEDDMRFKMKQSMQAKLGSQASIYEMTKTKVGGCKAIYVDYSGTPGYRGASYFVSAEKHPFVISLSCDEKSFLKNKKLFDDVLKTIKIEK